MKDMFGPAYKLSACALLVALSAAALPASASDANWRPDNIGLHTFPDAMQQTVEGVVVTVSGAMSPSLIQQRRKLLARSQRRF